MPILLLWWGWFINQELLSPLGMLWSCASHVVARVRRVRLVGLQERRVRVKKDLFAFRSRGLRTALFLLTLATTHILILQSHACIALVYYSGVLRSSIRDIVVRHILPCSDGRVSKMRNMRCAAHYWSLLRHMWLEVHDPASVLAMVAVLLLLDLLHLIKLLM